MAFRCTVCGVEVAKRREHTENDCSPQTRPCERARLAALQARVDVMGAALEAGASTYHDPNVIAETSGK